jgi:Spy/CpxP family protein refolding chaperone
VTGEVRKKAALWLALVFVLGAATGGVFGFNLAHRSYASTKAPVLNDAERRAKKVDEMTREIGLDAEQSKKVDAIITGAQAEMRSIRDKGETEVDAVRMKARDEMRTLLTPEQKAKFEEYVKRLDEEHKRTKEGQGH